MYKLSSIVAGAALTLALVGCSSGPHGQEIGIGAGAIAGGALGAAVSRGNPVAAVGGAAIGALIGNSAGKEYDRRHGRTNYN